jgi:hypothetical protein
MPSSRHVQKSQEHIYVRRGKGNRARYVEVAVDLPRNPSSVSASNEGLPDQIPIVIPPSAEGQHDDFQPSNEVDEGSTGSTHKKTGKVSYRIIFIHTFKDGQYLETIGLYETVARRKESHISRPHFADESWPSHLSRERWKINPFSLPEM